MLHLLLSIALCIFIGERLWHYSLIIRLRREEKRYLASLNPPEPAGPPAAWKVVLLLGLGVLVAAGLAAIGNAAMH